jgi:soluble lytic murein transglycosylase-like protein
MFVVILPLCIPCHADIYAFVDSNGVRHISNIRDDPRYQLIMRTPEYRPPNKPRPSSYAPSKSMYLGKSPFWKGNSLGRKRFAINEVNRKRYAQDVAQIATQYNLDPALMHAVISAESAYNPYAVSPKGAMGLMQLMPDTARRFGVYNPYDPIANMHGGARYLRWLIDRFNNTPLALAAYNAGEGAVENYGNSIPPYQETQTYVTRVLSFYNYYRQTY